MSAQSVKLVDLAPGMRILGIGKPAIAAFSDLKSYDRTSNFLFHIYINTRSAQSYTNVHRNIPHCA